MFMTISQILNFLDSPKTQKSKYPESKTFFLQFKNSLSLYIKGYNVARNGFLTVLSVTYHLTFNHFTI